MEYLQEQFEKYRLNNPSCSKPRYWNFRSSDLFRILDEFKDRLNCIKVSKKKLPYKLYRNYNIFFLLISTKNTIFLFFSRC